MRNKNSKEERGSIAMTALKIFVALFFVSAVGLIAFFGYLQVDGGPETPEFEQTGQLRFEVTNDWENPGPYDGYDRSEIESLVVEHTNEERGAEGLDTLEPSDRYKPVARNHSADMANNGYVGHVDSGGRNTTERVSPEPDVCSEIGENTAATYYQVPVRNARTNETERPSNEEEIADMLVDDWMASPVHRQEILRESYDSVSVGVYVSQGNAVFATQVFCAE